MVSCPELGSDPPIGSDQESRCDTFGVTTQFLCREKGGLSYWVGFFIAIQSLCRDSGARTGSTKEFCRDREFSVATDSSMFFVAIDISLSQLTSQGLLSRQRFSCHDRVCPFGVEIERARSELAARTQSKLAAPAPS